MIAVEASLWLIVKWRRLTQTQLKGVPTPSRVMNAIDNAEITPLDFENEKALNLLRQVGAVMDHSGSTASIDSKLLK